MALTNNTNINIYEPRYFSYGISLIYGNTAEDFKEEVFTVDFCKRESFPLISEQTFNDLLLFTNYCIPDQT
jgi:hypothetical protein